MTESYEVHVESYDRLVFSEPSLQEVGVAHMVVEYEWGRNKTQDWSKVMSYVPTWDVKNKMIVRKPLHPMETYKMEETK